RDESYPCHQLPGRSDRQNTSVPPEDRGQGWQRSPGLNFSLSLSMRRPAQQILMTPNARRSGCADPWRAAWQTQRGVALVITLIMLAVITTLAIAFLGLTHRETGAVDAMGKTTDAELACDGALERAKAQIMAPFQLRNATNNGWEILGPDFFVSVCSPNSD